MISLRGFCATGRPPFLMVARASISGVSSGSSAYSRGLMTFVSTRVRSDFKERRDARFFAAIGFPHAKDVAAIASGRVTNNNHSTMQEPVADHPGLAVILAGVLHLRGDARKDDDRILKIQATSREGSLALGRIVGFAQVVVVTTETSSGDRWSDGMDSPRPEFGIIVPAGLMWCGVSVKPEGVLR